MRFLNLLFAFLYLSLLATTETANAHDQRLSPLADSQFKALNVQHNAPNHATNLADHEPDEPDSLLVLVSQPCFVIFGAITTHYIAPWLSFSSSPDSARAPPFF